MSCGVLFNECSGAGELAVKMGADLHVLAVAYRDCSGEEELREFAKIEHLGGMLNVIGEIAKSHAEQARRQAETQGAKTVKVSVAEGDPIEEILAFMIRHDFSGEESDADTLAD